MTSHTVYVTGISTTASFVELYTYVSHAGAVASIHLEYAAAIGSLSGTVWYTFASGAEKAARVLNGCEFHGKRLFVVLEGPVDSDDEPVAKAQIDVEAIMRDMSETKQRVFEMGTIVHESQAKMRECELERKLNNQRVDDMLTRIDAMMTQKEPCQTTTQ